MIVHYRTGYRHQLVLPYEQRTMLLGFTGGNQYVSIDAEGLLTIAAGYAWDGASGPAFNDPSFVRPSLVHDALYQLIREGVLPRTAREFADRLLGEMLRDDMRTIADRHPFYLRWPLKALSAVRPLWVEAAVRLGGGVAMAMHSDEILTAP